MVTGPACDAVCTPLAKAAVVINRPVVTYACVSADISPIPSITRTVPPFTTIGPVLEDYSDHFGWTRVGIVVAQDEVWQTTGNYLQVPDS